MDITDSGQSGWKLSCNCSRVNSRENLRTDAAASENGGSRCLLEALVSEVQLCENIKLEQHRVKWRLLSCSHIERKHGQNSSNAESTDSYGDGNVLHPHNAGRMRVQLIYEKAKLRMTDEILHCGSGQTRSIIWTARFRSKDEARNWHEILTVLNKKTSPMVLGEPNTAIMPYHKWTARDGRPLFQVQSRDEVVPVQKHFLFETSKPPTTTGLNRRNVILRGTVQKSIAGFPVRRGLRIIIGDWQPVTWIAYNDGTLEEYAKCKTNHDLLSTLKLNEFSVRSACTRAEHGSWRNSIYSEPFATKMEDSCLLELRCTVNGRIQRYRAPNKLLQVQWLNTLTALSNIRPSLGDNQIPSSLLTRSLSEISHGARFRSPKKMSVLQEKQLFDVLGVPMSMWINVIWEYSDDHIIRRRYAESNGHYMHGGIIQPAHKLKDLIMSERCNLAIPSSAKKRTTKWFDGENSLFSSNSKLTHTEPNSSKSGRRFTISLLENGEEKRVVVKAQSSHLRDEWFTIIHNMRANLESNTVNTSINCKPMMTKLLTSCSVSAINKSTSISSSLITSNKCVTADSDCVRQLAIFPEATIVQNNINKPVQQTNIVQLNNKAIRPGSGDAEMVDDERIVLFTTKYHNDVMPRKTQVVNFGEDCLLTIVPRIS